MTSSGQLLAFSLGYHSSPLEDVRVRRFFELAENCLKNMKSEQDAEKVGNSIDVDQN